MMLTTHIAVSTVLASPFIAGNETGAIFASALLGHYLIDAVPHYDYSLYSAKQEHVERLIIERYFTLENIKNDLLRVGVDILLGTAILFGLYSIAYAGNDPSTMIRHVGLIVAGATLPDFLQAGYIVLPRQPLTFLKKIHDFFHAKKRLRANALGYGSQIGILTGSLLFLFFQ